MMRRREDLPPFIACEQSIYDEWIELLTAKLEEFCSHVSLRKRATIGPYSRHCVDRISYHDHARRKRDLVALDSIGIASAAKALMVVPNRWNEFSESSHCGDEFRTIGRMLLHNRPLLEI